MKPTVKERFSHILEAMEAIDAYLGGMRVADISDVQSSAIFYKLLVIGEASRHIPDNFQDRFSDIPWKRMLGLRNVLAHEYFKLKAEKIQSALDALPLLRHRIQEILEQDRL